jgi:beta-N-acetylhexosaminidase
LAAELLAIGVDFSFAPVLDLDYATSSVIGDRAFHSNPDVVVKLAGSLIKGMHKRCTLPPSWSTAMSKF